MLEPVSVDPADPYAVRLKEIALGLRVQGHIFHSYDPDPTPSSLFAEANALYSWEKSSDWCREYISAALESASLWADYYMPQEHRQGLAFAPATGSSQPAVEPSLPAQGGSHRAEKEEPR